MYSQETQLETNMNAQDKFELWGIIELFGHQKMAGKVTEQTVGGSALIRIDVPNTDRQPAFTRFLNMSAIYAINPVTEEVATASANSINSQPINVWDAREILRRADEQKKLNPPAEEEEEEEEEDEYELP